MLAQMELSMTTIMHACTTDQADLSKMDMVDEQSVPFAGLRL